ncbi:hypothetical protein CLF_113095, partial [Clonorchis sinensis]
ALVSNSLLNKENNSFIANKRVQRLQAFSRYLKDTSDFDPGRLIGVWWIPRMNTGDAHVLEIQAVNSREVAKPTLTIHDYQICCAIYYLYSHHLFLCVRMHTQDFEWKTDIQNNRAKCTNVVAVGTVQTAAFAYVVYTTLLARKIPIRWQHCLTCTAFHTCAQYYPTSDDSFITSDDACHYNDIAVVLNGLMKRKPFVVGLFAELNSWVANIASPIEVTSSVWTKHSSRAIHVPQH